MRTLITTSTQQKTVNGIMINFVSEYILDNGKSCFTYKLTEVVDNGDSYNYNCLGFKTLEFESWNNSYIERVKNGRMVEYTDSLLNHLATR
jgi:hypothetical protein